MSAKPTHELKAEFRTRRWLVKLAAFCVWIGWLRAGDLAMSWAFRVRIEGGEFKYLEVKPLAEITSTKP